MITTDKELKKFNKEEEQKEKRKEKLNKLMDKNKQVKTLSDNQHEALRFLCTVRHEMHSGQKAFFLSDDPRHSKFELLIGPDGNGTINQTLEEAGLPKIDMDTDIFKVPTDDCFKREDFKSDYEYDIAKAKAFDRSDKLSDRLNVCIEKYLSEIDASHGTRYCPIGAYRFPKIRHAKMVYKKYREQEHNRVEQIISASVMDMMKNGFTAYEAWKLLQDYMDGHFHKNLFVVTISPAGLTKPPAEITKSIGLTHDDIINDYYRMEADIPGMVKTAIDTVKKEHEAIEEGSTGGSDNKDDKERESEKKKDKHDIDL